MATAVRDFLRLNPAVRRHEDVPSCNAALFIYEKTRLNLIKIRIILFISTDRLLCLDLGQYILELIPCCSCEEMKADEWQFLCATHHTPQDV
jgi:hypothetical protein